MEDSNVQGIRRISDAHYAAFISKAKDLHDICPDLSRWSDENLLREASVIAGELFGDHIDAIQRAIDDPQRAVIAVDIPSSHRLPVDIDAFWGCAVALAMTGNLFVPQHDSVNGTPFTVYAASYEKSRHLTAAGLPPMAPEEKLGFHVDGTVHHEETRHSNQAVAVPHYLMLYNVLIAYERPGSFHWLPFAAWSDLTRFAEQFGIDKKYRIHLTPSVYETRGGVMENQFPSTVEAPLFFRNVRGHLSMYLNGRVAIDPHDDDVLREGLEALSASLMASPGRVSIPQRARRAIFACNLSGAHARDVFAAPFPDADFGRIFLRSTDSRTHVFAPELQV